VPYNRFRALVLPWWHRLKSLDGEIVVPAAGGTTDFSLVVQVDLHPIAVELDLVNPSGSGRHPLEPRERRFFDR